MKVSIVKLTLPDKVLDQIRETLKSGMWAETRDVRELEKEFADYCGVTKCRAVNNGTAALISILGALNLEPEAEVICPSFTFIATANCLKLFNLKPVFADIDPLTFNINPESIREKVSDKTAAILAVDLFGLCADYDAIDEIAEDNDIVVLEDACQAHGAEYKGHKAGSFGKAAAFSLYPTKNMFCGAEGGLVTTNDEDLYTHVNRFVNHGQSAKYVHTELGYNFRMPAVAGIGARYSLSVLDENNKKRIQNAELYNDLLGDIDSIQLPTCPKDYTHVYHQYTIRSANRDAMVEELIKNQIGFGIHYKIPIHKQKYYMESGYDATSLPVTEKAAAEVISLPIHPELTEEQIHFVADVIKNFV